ncbi:MAG TPA: FAD-dependent oxidoreductase [Candidatus Binataceae bacterium]
MSPSDSHGGSRPIRTARVERIFDHTSDTRSLFLAPVDSGSLRYLPGQFISIAITLPDETRTRPYTIASPPERGMPFEICFNRVPGGRGADWLFDRRLGDSVEFTGPYGTFMMDSVPAVETIFLADATAVAPIRPMIRRASGSPASPMMTLLYAARSPDHILYRAEFESLAAGTSGFHFEPLILPQSELYEGLCTEAERRWVRSDADRSRQFYICGVGKGVLALRDLLRGAGYERRAVHYEQW